MPALCSCALRSIYHSTTSIPQKKMDKHLNRNEWCAVCTCHIRLQCIINKLFVVTSFSSINIRLLNCRPNEIRWTLSGRHFFPEKSNRKLVRLNHFSFMRRVSLLWFNWIDSPNATETIVESRKSKATSTAIDYNNLVTLRLCISIYSLYLPWCQMITL